MPPAQSEVVDADHAGRPPGGQRDAQKGAQGRVASRPAASIASKRDPARPEKTRTLLNERGLHGRIAHEGEKAPIQASQRWHVERTHAWQNAFHRLARCYERRVTVIDAFLDLADTIITVRSLIRQAWTTHRWDERPSRRP